jgi:hypothetical protein
MLLLVVFGTPQDCVSADGKLTFTVSIRARVQIANNEAPTSSYKLELKARTQSDDKPVSSH